ncbi:hypothetical protein RUM43_010123 [Polyplax serrata]|uniref:Uncharacterized protein n=1 Tax=Polyplax serrata TaxID=468196 RepID=A0AAN8S074_POLSC
MVCFTVEGHDRANSKYILPFSIPRTQRQLRPDMRRHVQSDIVIEDVLSVLVSDDKVARSLNQLAITFHVS